MSMFAHYHRIILDSIFPPTAHERLLRKVTTERFRKHYEPRTLGCTIALAAYESRTVQAAVAACKFEKNLHAATLLASLFDQWLTLHSSVGKTILIPIPLSEIREKERGFNQVTRVIDHITSSPRLILQKNWLIRPTDTPRQTSLGRNARLDNMKGVFLTTPYVTQTDWETVDRIIICDDVMTTGATLEAARMELRKVVPKGVTIICLAWAH